MSWLPVSAWQNIRQRENGCAMKTGHVHFRRFEENKDLMPKPVQRRDFIKSTALLAASSAMAARRGLAQSANDRITIGFIGTGRQGQVNLKTFLKHPDVEVAAVCDVYQPNLDGALQLTEGKAKAFRDFRRLLEMKEVQAVVIGSPDHWHALHTVLACQAGKDVYVEKPISVYLQEGRKMVQAARKYQRIVQVGTQQRSGLHFQKSVELIRSGHIGKVSFVRTWNFGNSFPEGIGNPPDSEPPKDLDWDFW